MRGRMGMFWVASVVACTGCYRTVVTTKSIEGNRSEQRIPLAQELPIWQSTWHVEPDAIVGRLDIQQCQTSRAWISSELRTTERKTYHSAGWAFVGLSSVASFAGAVAWDGKATTECNVTGCQTEYPANTFSKFMIGTSAVLIATGLALVLPNGDVTTEVVSTQPHATHATESCLRGHDLTELVVVARDEAGHTWPVRLASTGEARISLPQSPEVPHDVDLKLVVYRAPRYTGGLYQRGLVLETFRLP